MDEAINDYAVALKDFLSLTEKEFGIRIKVQKARKRLLMAKENLRGMERELIEKGEIEAIKQ